MSELCDAGWTEQEHTDAKEEGERLRLALASAKDLLAVAQGERDGARSEVERLRTVIDMWVESAKRLDGQRVEADEKLARAQQLADQWSREYRDNARQFARELRAALAEEVSRDEPRP
jgi:hypothetical protein